MEISLDNGMNFMSATEAMPTILEKRLWNAIIDMMDEETREKITRDFSPCTQEVFLEKYLENAEENLIIG